MTLSQTAFQSDDRPGSINESLERLLIAMSDGGLEIAAGGATAVAGETLAVSEPAIRVVPLSSIQEQLGGPENEAVGIYLRSDGGLAGQMMILIPYPKAFELVDLLVGLPTGTTYHLGPIERSALAEMGSLCSALCLNAITALTGQGTRPVPPAVVVDMVGAILDLLLASWDGLSENALLVQANFLRGGRAAHADFWLIPDRGTLDAI